MIDSHTHLHVCKPDDAELVAAATDAGVTRMLTVGTTGASCRQALQAGDETRVLSALTEFSDVMADAGGNRRLEKALDELRSVLLMIANTSLRRPGREARSLAEHERILAAIRAGDAEEAAAATEAHIRSIEEDSVGSDGSPAIAEAGSAQTA